LLSQLSRGVTGYKLYTDEDLDRWAFLRTVDATQTDTFGAPVVEDFKGIAVKDGDDEAGVICRQSGTREKKVEEYGSGCEHGTSC